MISIVTTSQLMINPHGFTCINFNTQAYPGALYIVIPSKNNCKSDCVCPVVLIADQDCQNFQMCSCIMDTHFNDSLRICSTTQSYLQLCISNVTSGMNNTNVHLYTQRYTTCAPSYRKYVKAFKIIIRDIYSITFKTVTSTDRYNYIGVTGQTSTENLSRLVLSHTSEITRATDSEADLKTTIQGPTSNSSDTKLASDKKSPPSVRGTSILPIYVIGIVTTATCFTVIVIVIGVIIAVRKGKKQSPIHIYDDIGCIRESSGRHSQLHHTLSDESPTMTRNPIYNYQY